MPLHQLTPPARHWVETLGLQPHPEGGYFRETYRSSERVPHDALPDRYDGPRSFSTLIYFLLPSTEISVLHRLKTDESWHFYDGSMVRVEALSPGGDYFCWDLGRGVESGQHLQAIVPAGFWFGAHVPRAKSFALVGCGVAPGFEFDDFEIGGRGELVRRFPDHRAMIERLTRDRAPRE